MVRRGLVSSKLWRGTCLRGTGTGLPALEVHIMKKLTAILLGLVFTVTVALAGQATEADQKWLEAVQKMVAKGETKVSTPSETRVNLFKEWGEQHGYTIKVTQTEKSYSLEVSKQLVKK